MVDSEREMDFFFWCLIYCILFSASLATILLASRLKSSRTNLPPGSRGWPLIGETLEFAAAGRRGNPEEFIEERMKKYSPEVFRTCIMGENMAVMCGASGHRLLFSNDDKLFSSWWPNILRKMMYFPTLFDNPSTPDLLIPHTSLYQFLKPEALKRNVKIMDLMARKHIEIYWSPPNNNNQVINVYPLSKKYTYDLSCRLFMNIQDPEIVSRISHGFDHILAAFISLPVDIPGTTFNRGIKASNILHRELREIIRKRKKELEEKRSDLEEEEEAHHQDLLSYMLLFSDENGKFLSEEEISTYIINVLLASHETTSTAITFVVKHLAQLPDVFDAVFKEQMEIAKFKGPKEYLNWNDIQKMKYSWNVARETLRLYPPALGSFREALVDLNYAGFTIPKGWKTHWNVHSTHKNPEYFPDPEKFDPSRFEGQGPAPYTFVPFGGGPHMCPGKEYARIEILVFMYNVMTRLHKTLEIVNPNEKITYNPAPIPENGLPIRLQPRQM